LVENSVDGSEVDLTNADIAVCVAAYVWPGLGLALFAAFAFALLEPSQFEQEILNKDARAVTN